MKNSFKPCDILLPKHVDMKKWSVVACDQYTSQPEYWERVRSFIGQAPSTLHLMLPEVDLENAQPEMIYNTMRQYMADGMFRTLPNTLIYLKRTLNDGSLRQGLIGALDLECYDYHKGAASLCRATEGTVEERLPPRIRIREKAPIEMPHIMVLIDDPRYTVIEALESRQEKFSKIYDFELMEQGGKVQGFAIDEKQAAPILDALYALAEGQKDPLLFAMGDGNHSLATAKVCYENLKKELGEEAKNHPARYCLVELTNLHSPALQFEPIHRIVINTDTEKLMAYLKAHGLREGGAFEQKIQVVQKGIATEWSFEEESSKLAVGSLQNLLDQYLADNAGTVDYIHGEEITKELSMEEDSIGFILPDVAKESLFPTVIKDGALPRKTFSMGHAHDKRFYLECRRIEK